MLAIIQEKHLDNQVLSGIFRYY